MSTERRDYERYGMTSERRDQARDDGNGPDVAEQSPSPGKATRAELELGSAGGAVQRAVGKGTAVALAYESGVVQRRAGGDARTKDPTAVAAKGTSQGGGSLPHLEAIQRSFGSFDITGVRAHVGGEAARASDELGATAYAYGESIAFATAPDLHTAAHEAAHVVQQRRGVSLQGGIDGGAGDPYERHADEVADAVVRGESAEALLKAGPGGGGSSAVVQRKPGEVDTTQLADGTNFQILADGSVLLRIDWVLSAPDKKTSDDGGVAAPSRMVEILNALRASHLTWIDPAQIAGLSQQIGFSGGLDPTVKFKRFQIAFSVYRLIGPPPGSDVIVAADGNGVAVIVRQSAAIPGPIDPSKKVALSSTMRDQIVTAIERFAKLQAEPSVRNTIINGNVHWPVTPDPSARGIQIPFTQAAMEQLFGAKQWQAHLKKPERADGSGVITGADGEKVPQWLPKGTLQLSPKLAQYVTGADVQVEVKWDLDVHEQAGFVLLPNHCEYEWTVKHNGKTVDHEGTAILFDNRGTSLNLDGGPGTYEVSVVAKSRHFLTPDKSFRAKVVITAVDEATADKDVFDKAATGKDGPFVRDRHGLHLKPGEKALSTKDEITRLDATDGAIEALKAKGKLTQADYDVLKAELAKQRAAVEEVGKKTAGAVPYIIKGTFVSREDSTSIQLRLLMHQVERSSAGGQGKYAVLLHDTTFGTPVQHPGAAEGPIPADTIPAFRPLEKQALEDMADHFHLHNDLPNGTLHLAAQQLTSPTVWEATRDTNNGIKTGKKVLGGIALVGGVALLFIPGGGFVSAAVFAVTASAGAASVALEIQDRYEKEGELKFDRRLALDVLQLVSVALPFGTMTRVLAQASQVAKVGYLLSMASVDVAQGFLIAADVRGQLQLIDANTAFALGQTTSDEEKKQIMADRDRKVAQVIGGAMVNGGFILISVGGGIKRVAGMLRSGTGVLVRAPVETLHTQGREAMATTLERGYFEHTNAKGEVERVMLTAEERAYLTQELAVKDNSHGAPDTEGKDAATGKEATDAPATGGKDKGRVTEPVPGLFDAVDVNPHNAPSGWTFIDSPVHAHPTKKGWVQMETKVLFGGEEGIVQRSYDPATNMLVMDNAFLDKLPSKIQAGVPMTGTGTPLVTYLSIRQMKLLGAKFGETKVVKMSTIQNIDAVMHLEQMRRQGATDLDAAVAKTSSVTYATTAIQQSGQVIKGVKIDTAGQFPWKLGEMMDHFGTEPAKREALCTKYGLTQDDVVMVNYDIYIDVAPFQK